jgi:hypothetical protein
MFGKIKDMLSLERWIENFEGYLDARIELVKFDVKEYMVGMLTRSFFFLGILVFGMAALICLNFGLAYLINYWLETQFSGFLILAGFYFLVALVFYLSRDNPAIQAKLETKIRVAIKQPRLDDPKTQSDL